jgi:hypothetical protein
MKTILLQMMLIQAMLLLSVAGGSAQVLSTVYSFDNNTNDDNPIAGLLLSGSTLYGTAYGSADNGSPRAANLSGAVFKLNTNGTGFTNFYLFSPVDQSLTNTDGANSEAQLVLSGNRLYGTTVYGGHYKSGSFANGTVFAINTDGTGFTNLYYFSATVANPSGFFTNSDGANPSAGLVLCRISNPKIASVSKPKNHRRQAIHQAAASGENHLRHDAQMRFHGHQSRQVSE